MTTPNPANKGGLPLLALAVGAFGIGVTEFSPMGLLPVIAEGVNVPFPAPACWSAPTPSA